MDQLRSFQSVQSAVKSSRPLEGRKYINLQSGSAEKDNSISQVKSFLRHEISKYASMLKEIEAKESESPLKGDALNPQYVSISRGDTFGTKDIGKKAVFDPNAPIRVLS